MTATLPAIICAIDQSPHESLEALHKHLRSLKVKQEDYYTQWAPRRDRATGEVIPFKAPASEYLKREFLNRNTLIRWFQQEPEAAREWATNWLRNRKAEKELIYAPCQVELRSLLCPSRIYYDRPLGAYDDLCESLGYQIRFPGRLPSAVEPLSCPVIIDTREQKPLKLPGVEIIRAKVNAGDYGLPAEHDQNVYIERKSLSDFIGTLSSRETRAGDSNLDRFTRELERATEIGAYVIMLVEQKLDDALGYKDERYNAPLFYAYEHVKVSPEHLFHNLRALLHRFPHNFQALFVNGRRPAAGAVTKLLAMGEAVKGVDLQYSYDSGALTFV